MALVNGDTVIPAGVFNGEGRAADLSNGTLCPEGVSIGAYQADAGNNDDQVYAQGRTSISASTTNQSSLRKVTAYTGDDLLGNTVSLIGKPAEFNGVVVQQFDVELDDTGGNGTQEPVILVKAQQFFYVTTPDAVEAE